MNSEHPNDTHNRLREELDEAMAHARSRVAELTERVSQADLEANNLSASIREQWQRRVDLMRNGREAFDD